MYISEKYVKKTLILQHDQSDCGVACLLSLVQFYQGGAYSLERLRELSGTNKEGTTLLGLYQAAHQIGFAAEGNKATIPELKTHKEPLILHVIIEGNLQHYVICYGYQKGKFIVGDPSKGIVYYTEEEMEKIWKTKACLTLSPNQDFVTTKIEKNEKKHWFISLLKKDRKILTFSILLGICVTILSMAMVVFSQKLIDDILPSRDFRKLITGIVLVAFLLLIQTILGALRDYFLIRQSKDFNNRIVDRFYSALLHLPKPFFDTRKIGELVARLNDTARIQDVISLIAGSTIINILTTIVSLFFLFHYSWQTGLIASLSLPIYFILIYRFNNKIIRAQKEVMQGHALSESNYITSMQGIATIKNSNKQAIFRKINQLIYGNFEEKSFQLGKINIQLSLFSGLFGVFFLIGILLFTSIQVYNQHLQLGELMAILGISGSLLPAVAALALVAIPINEAKVAFNRMYEFASIGKEPQGERPIDGFQSLEVKNVSFRFAGYSPLLKNINVVVNKHECIAIVGESGCGKSTLGQVLQKFYTPENGEIKVNNTLELKELKTNKWRNMLGIVPQEITVFNGSLIDNILLGTDDNPEHIMDFVKKYGFEHFVESLPQGFATILGEEGINLSGGQKQLIALMRALYKNPRLLILDEATSAMDRNTEQFVLQLLNSLKSELAIIFISHRLHSLHQIADRIYILEKGVTAEFGTHEELMETSNFYSDYWTELKAGIV